MKKVFTMLLLLAGGYWLLGQTTHVVEVSSNVFTPAEITVMAGDTVLWKNIQGWHNVNGTQSTFPDNAESFGNTTGSDWEFSHVFTVAGVNDYQCDPHVGLGMVGKVTVLENAEGSLTLSLEGMTPHAGQQMWLSVIDKQSMTEVVRVGTTVEENFSISLPGLEAGKAYMLDFFADHNGNGSYDAPPADHAWRMEIAEATGEDSLSFTHNTNFTDIMWQHRIGLMFSGMTPHAGQEFTLYVRDGSSGDYLDTLMVEMIEESFNLYSYVVEQGKSYTLDFYADHNGNGSYDPPPGDHAWRIQTESATGDLEVEFVHNTNFTDIFATTGFARNSRQQNHSIYPNPASDRFLISAESEIQWIRMYSISGALQKEVGRIGQEHAEVRLDGMAKGLYLIEVRTKGNGREISRLLIQ